MTATHRMTGPRLEVLRAVKAGKLARRWDPMGGEYSTHWDRTNVTRQVNWLLQAGLIRLDRDNPAGRYLIPWTTTRTGDAVLAGKPVTP